MNPNFLPFRILPEPMAQGKLLPWALFGLILSLALVTVNPGWAGAQTEIVTGREGPGLLGESLFADQPQLFANDGRIKIVVLGLNPFGLTESASESIGLILQKNLTNTGHFDVVGPREVNAAFEKAAPDLVDCREIACGVESGKRLGAGFVIVGTLQFNDPVFILRVRMIDTTNNLTDFEEEIRFRDETRGEDMFRLANNISRNSLLRGRVLNTSIRGIVISLGKVHGIKIGDHLVIFKEEVPNSDLEGKQVDTQRKNLAIANVLNVNQNSSEAIIVHKTEEPQVGFSVQTYLDNQRQIELIENTRRELDTGIRLANRIRPLELAPEIVIDTERAAWVRAVEDLESDRGFWFTMGLIAGGATLFVAHDFDSGEMSDQLQLGAAGTVFGFAIWKWVQARSGINELMVEGRSKGYVSYRILPYIAPGAMGVRLALRF